VLFSNDIFISLRWHKFELFSTICIVQGVDEEIKEINFFNLLYEFVNFAQELVRVDIIDQIDI
jgi:hypothetical protein